MLVYISQSITSVYNAHSIGDYNSCNNILRSVLWKCVQKYLNIFYVCIKACKILYSRTINNAWNWFLQKLNVSNQKI